jgi:hypothetical protein
MQNEARDRLVNLINQDNCPSPFMCSNECKYAHLKNCCGDRLADHLIENGVIVLPCKVGDTVYVLSNGMILQTEIIRVKYEEEAENYSKFIRERVYAVLCNVEREFDFFDFGETVFLTKEEAEQKLKGGATSE